jgi:hypothetical protein
MQHLNDINRDGKYPVDKTGLTAIEGNFKVLTEALGRVSNIHSLDCAVLRYSNGTALSLLCEGNDYHLADVSYSDYQQEFIELILSDEKGNYVLEKIESAINITGEDNTVYQNVIKTIKYKFRPAQSGEFAWSFYWWMNYFPSLYNIKKDSKIVSLAENDNNLVNISKGYIKKIHDKLDISISGQTKVALGANPAAGVYLVCKITGAQRSQLSIQSVSAGLMMHAYAGSDVIYHAYIVEESGELNVYIVVHSGTIPQGYSFVISGVIDYTVY